MLEAFVYVFISLSSPNYPEIALFPVYRQGIAGLNISLSKNILTVINAKIELELSAIFFSHVAQQLLLSEFPFSVLLWPNIQTIPCSLPLLAALCSLLNDCAPALKCFKILPSFTQSPINIFIYTFTLFS